MMTLASAPGLAGETEDLVTSNIRFVVRIAREYGNRGLPLEDLVNEGNVGLLEAARRFDPARGVTFLSYAVWWIRKSMIGAVARNAHIVHIPEYQRKRMRDLRNTGRALERALGREPGREEISRALDVPIAKVDRLLHFQVRKLSLDETAAGDQDTTLLEQLADDRSVSPEEEMARRQDRARLRVALRSLSGRELSVIVGRFGLDGGGVRTLRELARTLGLSREAVRLIEERARKRLGRAMARQATVMRGVPKTP
jgi:RNA polymerase primary sigma factor